MQPEPAFTVSLIAPRKLVKTLKNALESQGKLDKSVRIQPLQATKDTSDTAIDPDAEPLDPKDSYVIPTTIRLCLADNSPKTKSTAVSTLLAQLNLQRHSAQITLSLTSHFPSPQTPTSQQPKNLLTLALKTWLHSLPTPIKSTLPSSPETLLANQPWTYTIYPPLLLLPPFTFTSLPWPDLLSDPHQAKTLYTHLTTVLKVTHIALNGPIPLHHHQPNNPPSNNNNKEYPKTPTPPPINHHRTPHTLTPLHGNFGPPSHHLPSASPTPTPQDLKEAFWCTARQNQIFQTWAPRHTMFSRGNIAEKARLLRLLSHPAPHEHGLGEGMDAEEEEGEEEGVGEQEEEEEEGGWAQKMSAVDLYAGVGYFAFCYARAAGVGRVFCWEVSGWSVEGLRRGAGANGWGVRVVREEEEMSGQDGGERVVVFHEDNAHAARRVAGMRGAAAAAGGTIPSVRHVNCGFLPSSEPSWGIAVRVLDPVLGGWVHAHENIGVGDVERRRGEVVRVFEGIVREVRAGAGARVECRHLQRVKSYAPGVMHCVLDMYIGPVAQQQQESQS